MSELFSPTYLDELKRSKEQVGFLHPVLVDQEGKIIDGRHRKAIFPDWPETQKEIQSPVQRLQTIIHLHLRRPVPQSETKENLIKLAIELKKTGLPPGEIAKNIHDLVPFTEAYIRMLLPPEFKDQAQAGRASTQSRLEPFNVESGATELRPEPIRKLKRIVQNFETLSAPIVLPFLNCACATCEHKKECYG